MRSVLVIDDEIGILQSLSGALSDEGYSVRIAATGEDGMTLIRAEKPDVVMLDIWMPGIDGLEVLKRIKSEWPDQTVIMMSGHGTIETAVKATKAGAYDFVEKPLSLERILVLLKNISGVHDLSRENQALRQQVQKSRQLVGESAGMRSIQELVRKVAPTSASVLITGENGTGKEVVAHSIHALSLRYGKPFVEVNCAAIPEELIESELFGHEKGAFTGATQLKRGKFDLANGGTLFLDEIGDMSLKTQAKILRILQEQKFERVGGTQTISVDVRIVAATNKDLKAEISKGQFREDLFYRLNVVPFVVPKLSSRKQDIPLLFGHFMVEFSQLHGKKQRPPLPETIKLLQNYPWPGNVRELKNLVERLVILTPDSDDGKPLTVPELLEHIEADAQSPRNEGAIVDGAIERGGSAGGTSGKNLRDARQEFERDYIVGMLEEQGWNVSRTAAVLGIERSHLHRKMKDFKIEVPE